VKFTLDRSICTIQTGDMVDGFGTYTTSTNESVNVPLIGAGEAGSGILEGRQTIIGTDGRPSLVYLFIDAGDFCGAFLLARDLTGLDLRLASQVVPGTFSGHVDLMAL